MSRTRDEWLASLDWHDSPPPTWGDGKYLTYRVGLVYELKDGGRVIIGDINKDAGSCGCCGLDIESGDVARWAELFGETP